MRMISEHVRTEHHVLSTTDTIASYLWAKVRQR